MAAGGRATARERVGRLATSHTLDEESDGQLLRRFAEERDERAFALLVERRGALVLGVCARMLRNRADADDAFQAVFLVAAQRASALRRYTSLAGWLHNVAVRISLNVLRGNRRRHRQVQEAAEVRPEIDQSERLEALKQFIDEELAALPERLREVVVLCDLEGRTRGEVAQLLSIPASTVTNRLQRGRELMRKRLVRKGLTVAAGGAAVGLVWCGPAAPAVAADLVRETVRNADAFVWGTAAARATLSTQIVTLAEGALHAMLLAQWKVVVCFVAILTASMLGGAMAPSWSPLATSPAVAGPYFLDDFEDGNYADGSPATWAFGGFTNGELRVDDGSFVLDPLVVGDRPISAYVIESKEFQDGILRTRVRVENGGSESVGVFARSPVNDAILASIRPDGLLRITLFVGGSGQELASLDTDLNPVTNDVNLEFKLDGNSLALSAWAVGEAKPVVPQVVADASAFPDAKGEIGVYYTPTGGGAAQFRFFQAVPEPCTNYLAASMIGVAGFGLFFQRWRRTR